MHPFSRDFLTLSLAGTLVAAIVVTTAPDAAFAQTKGKTLNQAPTPVTPFGPRRKPPRGLPGAKLPKPEVVETHGIWRVLCEKAPVPGKKELAKTCYVSATRTDPKRKGLFMSMILLKVRGKDGKVSGHMVNLRAPIGVFLPTGIAMEIDGKAVARVPFTRCNPLFCESVGQARKETLEKLKKGKKAKFIVYAAPGVGLPLEFDLKGFSAAFEKAMRLP